MSGGKPLKYLRKVSKTDLELSNELSFKRWVKLKEPKNFKMSLLLIIPFAFTNTMLSFIVLMSFNNPIRKVMNNFSSSYISKYLNLYTFVIIIISAILVMIVHKLLHIIFIPRFRNTDNIFWKYSVFGISFVTKEKLLKKRYIVVSLMPFFIISIMLPILFGVFNLINWTIIFLAIFNALISSIDVLKLYLIIIQVPKNSYIIRLKKSIYYKES